MKKIILVLVVSASFLTVCANPPGEGSCSVGGPDDVCNGTCIPYWDANEVKSYMCVTGGTSLDCVR